LLASALPRRANASAVFDFMEVGLIDHSSATFFEGVYQLPGGHFLTLDLSDSLVPVVRRYWELRIEPKTGLSEEEATEEFHARFQNAILPVHYARYSCDTDAILAIAQRHGLKVVEDAAHALPSRYNGKMIGTIGDITCFSFYATKTMTTGEGGMLTTENFDFAERMRRLSLHGISKDAWKRYTAEGTWRYDILETGYKYNMTDLVASIGIAQLAKCEAMCARRCSIAERYNQALASLEAYEVPEIPADSVHAWHLYVLQVNPSALTIDRNRVVEELKSRGIGTSVHFIPLHLHTLYQEHLGYRRGDFPNAEERFERAISLPIYPGMTADDSGRVIEALRDIAREYRR
jgi:dTDP-4-amino-4,6-dideoxygalactose transaminase